MAAPLCLGRGFKAFLRRSRDNGAEFLTKESDMKYIVVQSTYSSTTMTASTATARRGVLGIHGRRMDRIAARNGY